ncbi:MAG: RNA methyltransferase [Actinomycetota bacterium]
MQRLRRLIADRRARRADAAFIIEGPQLVDEAVAAGVEFEAQFIPVDRPESSIGGAGPVHLLSPGVFERVAPTEQPRPPVAVARATEHDARAILQHAAFIVALEAIADPGNLGTIIRSAEAAGADGVVLTPGSVDPHNPKVVRAAAGSLFRIPVLEASLSDVHDGGLTLWGTTSHSEQSPQAYDRADLTGRVAVVLGTEAHGLSADAVGYIDRWLTIPHAGPAESLNVAMAGTVLAFEVRRQRAAEL